MGYQVFRGMIIPIITALGRQSLSMERESHITSGAPLWIIFICLCKAGGHMREFGATRT